MKTSAVPAVRRWHRLRGGVARIFRPSVADRGGEVAALAARVAHLEAALEGLQDALYRQALQHDRAVEELRARLKPEEIARALSDDARKRGL